MIINLCLFSLAPPDSPPKRLFGLPLPGSRPPMATPSQEPEKNNNEIPQAKPLSRLVPNSNKD